MPFSKNTWRGGVNGGDRRRQRLTRLGSHFVFVGTFAILGGSLRGFNLLLVVSGLVVAAMLVQWRWVRREIESVSLQRRLPDWAFAGVPFRVRFQLSNTSRWLPLAMLRIDDSVAEVGGGSDASAACGASFVRPAQTVSPHYECRIAKRGRYTFGPMTVSTSFPFGLVQSRLETTGTDLLYVYPALVTLRRGWERELDRRHGGTSATARHSGPSEGDFFGLRDWRNGDHQRWIHWRTSARTEHPVVRQFEQQRHFDTCILVDAYLPAGAAPRQASAAAELAISIAATIVTRLIGGASNRIVLAAAGENAEAVLGRGSGEGRRRMLRMLAELAPSERPDVGGATSRAKSLVGYQQDLLVISSRSLEAAIDNQTDLASTMEPWNRRSKLRWVDASDASIDRLIERRPASSRTSEVEARRLNKAAVAAPANGGAKMPVTFSSGGG